MLVLLLSCYSCILFPGNKYTLEGRDNGGGGGGHIKSATQSLNVYPPPKFAGEVTHSRDCPENNCMQCTFIWLPVARKTK